MLKGRWQTEKPRKSKPKDEPRDSQTRMTNDEIRRNDEIGMTEPATAQLRAFEHSGFGFLSSFVLRHSTTYSNQVHCPNACARRKKAGLAPPPPPRSRRRLGELDSRTSTRTKRILHTLHELLSGCGGVS